MNSFYIELNEMGNKNPRIRRLLVLGAATCLVFILLSLLILITLHSSLEWFFLAAALYLALYLYYAWITFKTILFVKADANSFGYKFGVLSNSKNTIMWNVVSKVKLGPAYVAFYKKSGRRKMVSLNWLPYSRVIEIKEMLIQMCKYKNIQYEKVDFINYNENKRIKKK